VGGGGGGLGGVGGVGGGLLGGGFVVFFGRRAHRGRMPEKIG